MGFVHWSLKHHLKQQKIKTSNFKGCMHQYFNFLLHTRDIIQECYSVVLLYFRSKCSKLGTYGSVCFNFILDGGKHFRLSKKSSDSFVKKNVEGDLFNLGWICLGICIDYTKKCQKELEVNLKVNASCKKKSLTCLNFRSPFFLRKLMESFYNNFIPSL